ncbi:helix-turn-helix domain-containing protein [Vallitalea okinawensis]|nr:helix-turn-helix domain-containing protein [Vallitalea okinawensis]
MGIIVNLDVIMAILFSTLEAICKELNCQPGDILEYVDQEEA